MRSSSFDSTHKDEEHTEIARSCFSGACPTPLDQTTISQRKRNNQHIYSSPPHVALATAPGSFGASDSPAPSSLLLPVFFSLEEFTLAAAR